LPDPNVDIKKKVENVVNEVIGEYHGGVTDKKKGTVTIPWPTRPNIPISEFTTQYVFTLAFLALFPFGTGDFHNNIFNLFLNSNIGIRQTDTWIGRSRNFAWVSLIWS
jgi:hypothetical protein